MVCDSIINNLLLPLIGQPIKWTSHSPTLAIRLVVEIEQVDRSAIVVLFPPLLRIDFSRLVAMQAAFYEDSFLNLWLHISGPPFVFMLFSHKLSPRQKLRKITPHKYKVM
jgi:hypothetical protein